MMYLPLPGAFDFGAYHAGDTPYIFEDPDAQKHFTDAQTRLSDTMTDYWAQFARTGHAEPAGPPAVAQVHAVGRRAAHPVPGAGQDRAGRLRRGTPARLLAPPGRTGSPAGNPQDEIEEPLS